MIEVVKGWQGKRLLVAVAGRVHQHALGDSDLKTSMEVYGREWFERSRVQI